MAFWKKSDDPWDVDPEKRKKPSTNWYEQDAPQGGEAAPADGGERLKNMLGSLFQRKEEAPIPPEKCPWCGKDMEWGCITGGRDGVRWRNWRPRGLGILRPENGQEFDLLDEGEWNLYKTTWRCAECGKLVADIQNPKPAAEVEEAYHKPASYEEQLDAWGASPRSYEDYQAQWGEKKEEI